ncbi:MAG: hypothetical protein GTO24_20695, partial [candidate division Zixibacteria bacterium]|nr:hypothetical protein [candidate division Zixibacteria bacterium]
MRIRDDGKFGMLVDPSMKLSIEALQGGYHRSSKPGKENDVVKNHIHDDP